jgi:hypothetical protein
MRRVFAWLENAARVRNGGASKSVCLPVLIGLRVKRRESQFAEQRRLRAVRREGDAHPAGGLDNAGSDLQQSRLQGGELGKPTPRAALCGRLDIALLAS